MTKRQLNPDKPVWVYRNLRDKCYSLMQDGRVVDRRPWVLLTGCRFRVRKAGRERVLREGHKNVHAFVVGTLTDGRCKPGETIALKVIGEPGWVAINVPEHDLPHRIRYSPKESASFRSVPTSLTPEKDLTGAVAVLLNERGMTAAYPYWSAA